ncbi:decarboxylating 6-phosphogluconate dehydrogenase [Candidatus Woesearchaeota archaeon]|nr:decarboxylating 6-phosphogluconate dehydrogenase [Candidatus Woesearchaeota archaeon]
MKLGFIGLGRMGFNMVLNLHNKKIPVVAFNRSPEPAKQIKKYGVEVAFSIEELMDKMPQQKIIWLMVTAGKPVDVVIKELLPHLKKEDIIIDGGNSFYKDSIRRYTFLKSKKIHFIDIGTSGGLKGARYGACLTIGGDEKIFKRIEPICKAVSAKNGYAYVGNAGAGHFVKMVHNGIEYALLQAYGDGFELLFKGPYKNLNLRKIAETWNNGSVIRGWLVELAADAFRKDPKLSKIEGIVGGGETGQWAVNAAKEFRVSAESIKLALKLRKSSKKHPTFAGKVIAALRNEFGGHEVIRK